MIFDLRSPIASGKWQVASGLSLSLTPVNDWLIKRPRPLLTTRWSLSSIAGNHTKSIKQSAASRLDIPAIAGRELPNAGNSRNGDLSSPRPIGNFLINSPLYLLICEASGNICTAGSQDFQLIWSVQRARVLDEGRLSPVFTIPHENGKRVDFDPKSSWRSEIMLISCTLLKDHWVFPSNPNVEDLDLIMIFIPNFVPNTPFNVYQQDFIDEDQDNWFSGSRFANSDLSSSSC